MRAGPPFDKRARIDARRRVALKINRVAFEFFGPPAEKMVEAHFVQSRRRGIRRDVPPDVVLDAIRAHHHRQRVPANQALDAALEFLVAGKERLQTHGDGVRIRRVCGKGQVDAADGRVGAQAFQDFRCNFRAAGFQHGIERLEPLLNLYVIDRVMRPNRGLVIHF